MMLFIKNPKTYKIKQGSHYSGLHVGLVLKHKLTFEVVFDESCLEQLPAPDNYDINKLYGFSDSYFHHHYSARVGWRCVDIKEGKIELVTYCYLNGKRVPEKTLCKLEPGKKAKCTMINNVDSYKFIVETENSYISHTVIKDTQHRWFVKYKLYPYHGGNLTAPHNMKITIKEL